MFTEHACSWVIKWEVGRWGDGGGEGEEREEAEGFLSKRAATGNSTKVILGCKFAPTKIPQSPRQGSRADTFCMHTLLRMY